MIRLISFVLRNSIGTKRGPQLLAGAVLSLACVSCGERSGVSSRPSGALGPLPTVTFQLGGAEVAAEIASSPAEQQQGLMYRESMPENHGMLFIYRKPSFMRFWMKNTWIPLAIAFIREDGVISNIEEMAPEPGPLDPVKFYTSRQRCLYALEMNAGWFEKHGVKPGDRIELPMEAIQRIARRGE
ncbi:MAG: DUF192 domain-containing protein [bacterium]